MEIAGAAAKPAAVTEHAATVSAIANAIASEPRVSATGPRHAAAAAADARSDARSALETPELIAVGAGLLPLGPDQFNVSEQFDQLRRAVAHVDALILAVLIDEVKLAEHSEEGHVGSGVVDDTLGAVLDEEF